MVPISSRLVFSGPPQIVSLLLTRSGPRPPQIRNAWKPSTWSRESAHTGQPWRQSSSTGGSRLAIIEPTVAKTSAL